MAVLLEKVSCTLIDKEMTRLCLNGSEYGQRSHEDGEIGETNSSCLVCLEKRREGCLGGVGF